MLTAVSPGLPWQVLSTLDLLDLLLGPGLLKCFLRTFGGIEISFCKMLTFLIPKADSKWDIKRVSFEFGKGGMGASKGAIFKTKMRETKLGSRRCKSN